MIIDHPKQVRALAPMPYYEPAKVMQCDFCQGLAPMAGQDIAEAVERAQKAGFFAVKPKFKTLLNIGTPLKWCCPECKDRPEVKP